MFFGFPGGFSLGVSFPLDIVLFLVVVDSFVEDLFNFIALLLVTRVTVIIFFFAG